MDLEAIRKQYMNKYGDRQRYLDLYYKDDKSTVPIYSRKPVSDLKSKYHTNLHINYPNMVVDFKVGYMGKDIEVNIVDGSDEVNRALRDFHYENNMSAKNAESIELSSVSGLSHRLFYIKNGRLRVKNIEGYKVVYIYSDDDLYDPEYAFYYYSNDDGDYCNVYDDTFIQTYQKFETKRGSKTDVRWEKISEEEHLLGEIPITPVENNNKWRGDFEPSIETIDRYDEILSDVVSEIKSIRGNYLVVHGDLFTEQDAFGREIPIKKYLKENNLIVTGTDDEGKPNGDVKVLDVNIPDEAIQNQLSNLRQHIFEESKSVDIKKIAESQDARVFTIKTTLMAVENNAQTTENYFKMALRKQYRIWAYYLANSGQGLVDYRDIEFTFNRNFPSDEQAKSQTLSMLFNYMSAEDAYRIVGYENPQELAERYKEDNTIINYESNNNLIEE